MVMSTYLDTSFLLKMYVYEAESQVAQATFSTLADPMINSLTDVEVASALFRRLPLSEAESTYADYKRDRRNRIYRKVRISEATFEYARVLAEQYSGPLLLRSLDLLHLATYDRRLATAATQLGLSVVGARP